MSHDAFSADILHSAPAPGLPDGDDALYERIAADLQQQGFSVQHNALPAAMTSALYQYQRELSHEYFAEAGIGRKQKFHKNEAVRTDKVCWIDGTSSTGDIWLQWCAALQRYLNRRLFMGLFSFESHFAHYRPGDFYKRHMDAFRGESNRVLSLVTYLNPEWQPQYGGELVIYRDAEDTTGISVTPALGTVVLFLSESFPHEVKPASTDRYSIAGWFRVNTSINNKVDPPK
ncbi:2OG-Fe(II) oxygenase [Salinimonas sediminis]|uniref:2OG-Fe(II) oxygenase n=1 Tax=Salinimonas sediminis TaxID=2303538 RepID=A0A346NMZ3_9ALTE|nr:2OG-Fe(II) oxygenase [Salinimonas sediminis]AXR06900.1 2OG-Fe(II) oxygenase [Salinimonas sediminis]